MTLIIGSGRMAHHFKSYFSFLKIPFQSWNRRQNSELQLKQCLAVAGRVLVLISDSSLLQFVEENKKDSKALWFHMSGALEIPGAVSLHPLMTFGPGLYSFDFYQKIPFVLKESESLQKYFPELPNPSYQISRQDGPKYHALCVLSGNFTTLLWLEAMRGFESMGLPREIIRPYMQKIFENLNMTSDVSPLTGPLARKDAETVSHNLDSLEGSPLKYIYQSFVKNYFPEFPL